MQDIDSDPGVVQALLMRLDKQRLPRALALKERVDRGKNLSELDIVFMHDVLDDIMEVKKVIDRHPEHQELFAKVFSLYKHITEKGLENEQKKGLELLYCSLASNQS